MRVPREYGGDVDGERGLAHTPFLVEKANDHEYLPEMRLCGIATLRVSPFPQMVKHRIVRRRLHGNAEIRKGDFHDFPGKSRLSRA